MNKNKQTIIAFTLIGSIALTTLVSVTLLAKTARELSVAVENRKVELINKANDEAYANTKSVLLQLKETNVDTISLSAIYYLIANSNADIIVTGVATSDTMAVSTVPEDVASTAVQQDSPNEEQSQTQETVQPAASTPVDNVQQQAPPVVNEQQQQAPPTASEQPKEEPKEVEKTETPKLPETRTGNPSVILTVRGDINTLLTYLDTTKLRYKIIQFTEHEKVKSCSIEIRR